MARKGLGKPRNTFHSSRRPTVRKTSRSRILRVKNAQWVTSYLNNKYWF